MRLFLVGPFIGKPNHYNSVKNPPGVCVTIVIVLYENQALKPMSILRLTIPGSEYVDKM